MSNNIYSNLYSNLYSNILNNYLLFSICKLLQKINKNPECFSTNSPAEDSVNGNKITDGFTTCDGHFVYGYYTGSEFFLIHNFIAY